MNETRGTIFHIQRFSIHDGPGIRTTVFFKGCPLRCFWCHNPEGLRRAVEIQFYPARCIGCGECARVCPQGAQEIGENGRVFHREICTACGECVETCYAEGLQKVGQEMSAGEVVAEVLQDRAFYGESGGLDKRGSGSLRSLAAAGPGGVTLSGGEPMLQAAFALEILAGCRENGISTALETTGHYRWETLARALSLVDLFLIDIKHMDAEKHRAATGVGNELILENIRKLARTGKRVIFRTPVIPGVNDTVEEIAAIAGFIRGLDGEHPLELLAFHKLAADKYRSLGMEYPAARLEPPGKEQMAGLAKAAEDRGVAVKVR